MIPVKRHARRHDPSVARRRRVYRSYAVRLTVVAAASLFLAACGSSSSSTTTTTTTAAAAAGTTTATSSGAHEVIGYANPLASEEGLRSVGVGEQKAIQLLGLNWAVDALDGKLSADTQVSNLDTFVTLHTAGITVWPLDQGANAAAYSKAKTGGIPIVGMNATDPAYATEIAAWTDASCIVSNQQAAYIASLVPHAKIIAIGGPPAPSITLTTNCFLAAAKRDGLDVLQFKTDLTTTSAGGQQITAAALLKYPDLQGVWDYTETSILGAAAAVKAAGKPIWSGSKKGIILISRNGTSPAAAAIKAGDLTATWDNNQPEVGAAAIQVLDYLLVQHVSPSRLPKAIPIPSRMWDPADISSYQSPLTRAVTLPLPKSFSGLAAWCQQQTPKCSVPGA